MAGKQVDVHSRQGAGARKTHADPHKMHCRPPPAARRRQQHAQSRRDASEQTWRHFLPVLLTSESSKASTPAPRSEMRWREKSATPWHSCRSWSSCPSLAFIVLLHSICLPFCTLTAAVTIRRPRPLLQPPAAGRCRRCSAAAAAAGRGGAAAAGRRAAAWTLTTPHCVVDSAVSCIAPLLGCRWGGVCEQGGAGGAG